MRGCPEISDVTPDREIRGRIGFAADSRLTVSSGCKVNLVPSAAEREPRWDPARFPPAARRNRWEQTLLFGRDPLGELARARNRVGPVFTLRLLPYQALICGTDPETSQGILTDQDRFAGGDAADLLEPIVGPHSLILTPAPEHLPNRKRLLPPFHGERIASWGSRVGELVRAHLPALASGAPVAVRPWAQRLALEVILRVVFGVEDPDRSARYRLAIDRIMDERFAFLLFAPPIFIRDFGRLSPGGAFARRRAAVDALLFEEIAKRRADPDAGGRDDVLSVLLDAGDFSDEALRDELMGLVLAGHETTATALSWTLHLLAHNPRAREALRADLAAGSDAYLKATIKESMRMRAPVLDAIRTATRDTELGGHPVPRGAYVSAMFCATHHAPELWQEPAEFRPERHLAGASPPYSLTPFGGGVRRCLGAALAQLELEVVLSELLADWVPEPAGAGLEEARVSGVTIVPARGGRVVLRRSSSERGEAERRTLASAALSPAQEFR